MSMETQTEMFIKFSDEIFSSGFSGFQVFSGHFPEIAFLVVFLLNILVNDICGAFGLRMRVASLCEKSNF